MASVISVFNNKGGVGKTTLSYHTAQALSEMGHKVLLIDADPQCNLTIYSLKHEEIHDIWAEENNFIDGFDLAKANMSEAEFQKIHSNIRSLHYILMPTEEGTGEPNSLPQVKKLADNLDLIPGRLTLHLYEEKIASRWSGLYKGEALSIRTALKIRELADKYIEQNNYDFVIIDTSPSLGILNKVVISTVDGFIIPASPDMFSLYGIKNIGKALTVWKKEFDLLCTVLNTNKQIFPNSFVSFLGYTLYNAKRYKHHAKIKNQPEGWFLAEAHYNYAKRIPETIKENIIMDIRKNLNDETLSNPIGGTAVMHTHNTFPSMAQYYHSPMWKVPSLEGLIEDEHAGTLRGSSKKYEETRDKYIVFCTDLINRLNTIK